MTSTKLENRRNAVVLGVALAIALALAGCGNTGANVPFGPGSGGSAIGGLLIANASSVRTCDINTLAFVSELTGSLGISGGFDDGHHMVADRFGKRIFVSNHDSNFGVYDFSLSLLTVTWGPLTGGSSLFEPLGLAVMSNGKILVTDEELGLGVFRLNSDLSLDASASNPPSGTGVFTGAEGVAYDAADSRIFVADEDADEVEIFDGSTLQYIGGSTTGMSSDGAYWIGVDGSSSRLFVLSDSGHFTSPTQPPFTAVTGIHVFDIIAGGDDISYDQTLIGSGGQTSDCLGTLAVSEDNDRLFAIDYCDNTVVVYDTSTLALIGTVPASCAGASAPTMVAVMR